MPEIDDMVEADEGDLDSDEDNQSDSNLNNQKKDDDSEEESKEVNNQNSQQSGKSNSSHDDFNYMEDVFNQLGGFEVGDYDDEDEQTKVANVAKKGINKNDAYQPNINGL